MKMIRVLIVLVAGTALGFGAPPQDTQKGKTGPKIADIRSYKGTVTISGPRFGTRSPRRIGRRIRNRSIFDEDKITTGKDGTCTVVFPDSSTVTLKPGSEIQVLQKKLKKPTAEGKTIGRRIRLLVGDIATKALPNRTIQTDYETPAGTASVRGTLVTITFDPTTGAATLTVGDGNVKYFNAGTQTLMNLTSGQSVQFSLNPGTGGFTADILVNAGRAVSGQIGATEVRFSAEGVIQVEVRDGKVHASAEGGTLEVKGESGGWDAETEFEGELDPDLGDDSFDPNGAPAGDPGFGPLSPGGGTLDITGEGSLESPPVNPAEGPGTTLDDGFTQLQEDIYVTGRNAIDLNFDVNDDAGNVLDETYLDEYAKSQADFDTDLERVKTGTPILTLANEHIAEAHDDWHGTLPCEEGPGNDDANHDGFHDGIVGFDEDLWSHEQFSTDLKKVAEDADAGIVVTHDLGHAIIGALHNDRHIVKDFASNYSSSADHNTLHDDVETLHNDLHSGDLHSFIHSYQDVVHNRWHTQFEVLSACGSEIQDFTSGVCKTSHDNFHARLNSFHDHAHGAFGVPK